MSSTGDADSITEDIKLLQKSAGFLDCCRLYPIAAASLVRMLVLQKRKGDTCVQETDAPARSSSRSGTVDPIEGARKSREISGPLELCSTADSLEDMALLVVDPSTGRSPSCLLFACLSSYTKHKNPAINELWHKRLFKSGHIWIAMWWAWTKIDQALKICYTCWSNKNFDNGTLFLHDGWTVRCETLTSKLGLAVVRVALCPLPRAASTENIHLWAATECGKLLDDRAGV